MAVHSFTIRKESNGSWEWGTQSYHFAWDAIADVGAIPPDILAEFFNNFLGGNYFRFGTCLSKLSTSYVEDLKVNGTAYTVWKVETDWKTLTPPEVERATFVNPLSRAPVVTYKLREVTDDIVEQDVNGDKIVNSADDPFVPGPTKRKGRGTICITKNFASFDPSLADQLSFRTNSATFFGYGANTLLCTDISAQQMSEVNTDGDTINFWSVTCEFESDVDSQWTLNILDKGLREVVSGKKREIKDDNGQVVTEPYFLNGAGAKLTTGSSIPDPIEFDIYESFDFGSLF